MKSEPKNNYLKYWRVIRYFCKAKYNLSTSQLDMLFFLYSEEYFSRDKFKEFNKLLSWNEHRFNNLKKEGWIETFRKKDGKLKALYGLSYKAQRAITSIYKKLNGMPMPVSDFKNPVFLKRNVPYSHHLYQDMILKMNESIKQQQHRSLE